MVIPVYPKHCEVPNLRRFLFLFLPSSSVFFSNGLFSMTTWVIQYQKGKTSLDLNEARDDGVLVWHWYQLDHKQTICTSLQTDNYTNIPSLGPNLFHGGKCQISRRFMAKKMPDFMEISRKAICCSLNPQTIYIRPICVTSKPSTLKMSPMVILLFIDMLTAYQVARSHVQLHVASANYKLLMATV